MEGLHWRKLGLKSGEPNSNASHLPYGSLSKSGEGARAEGPNKSLRLCRPTNIDSSRPIC